MAVTSVRIKFDKLMATTARAYLLRFGHSTEHWFPRRFCWGMVVNNKLGGNVAIPTWLYREKFGEEPCESDAETIIERHVPERKPPVEKDADESLTR